MYSIYDPDNAQVLISGFLLELAYLDFLETVS